MNAEERGFKYEDTTREIIGAFYDVYNELGYGFLETVHREAMTIVLRASGLHVDKELALSARFRGETVGVFKADLVVNGAVVVELKAVQDAGDYA
jgi:GxxExxY protein